MDQLIELKPCPHCYFETERHVVQGDAKTWYVECLFCFAQGPSGETAEEATKKWNERGGDPCKYRCQIEKMVEEWSPGKNE